jgi:hypothetical protein
MFSMAFDHYLNDWHQGLMIESVIQFAVAQLDQKFTLAWYDTIEDRDNSARCKCLSCVLDRTLPASHASFIVLRPHF